MADEKLVKVEMTFEDGRVQVLEGNAADAWLKDVNGCVMNSTVHHGPMNEHPWKESYVKQDKS